MKQDARAGGTLAFHGKLDGETSGVGSSLPGGSAARTGRVLGQPQVTLRMHVRHEKLFRWLEHVFPEGRLYGPYHHGGRDYYQWMARGDFLRRRLVPLVREHLPRLDDYAAARFRSMCDRYRLEPAGEPRPEPRESRRGGRRS